MGNWLANTFWKEAWLIRAFFSAKWFLPLMTNWSFKCLGGWKYLHGGFSRLHRPCARQSDCKHVSHTHQEHCQFTYFDWVVASNHSTILYFHVGPRMGKLALLVGACALVPLRLTANLELKPTRIFNIQNWIEVGHDVVMVKGKNKQKERKCRCREAD